DPSGVHAGELGRGEVTAHGVDVPAEDAALGHRTVDEDQRREKDEHDRQSAAVRELPGEGHNDGGDRQDLQREQHQRLDRLAELQLAHAGAPGGDGVADDRDGSDEQRERVVALSTDEAVEEAAGDLLVLRRERGQRDIPEDLQGQAAEDEHAGEGDDERRDPDDGDPEALPDAHQDAGPEGGEDADPPRQALLDRQDRGDGTGEGDDRADREVDVAGHDDHHHADGEDEDVGVLQDQVRHVVRREQRAAGEDGEERDDEDERDVDAALTQVARQELDEVRRAGHGLVLLLG